MPARPTALPILFETADYVAVDKPAGLAAIPGRAEPDSVLDKLAAQLALPARGTADPRLRVVHRIDKETTGIMLFAKHIAAQRSVSHQFQNNTVTKEYLALVHGKISDDSGLLETQIGNHATHRDRMAVLRRGGRPAITGWRVEQRFKNFTLVRVFPKTGKTHQIRVHLAHIGHPLVVDPVYGTEEPILLSQHKRNYRPARGEDERPLLARLGLHASSLTFTDVAGEPVTIAAPLPKDLRVTITQLGKA